LIGSIEGFWRRLTSPWTDVLVHEKLAERNLQPPLLLPQRPQAVQGEMDAFADADSGGTSEQEGIGE